MDIGATKTLWDSYRMHTGATKTLWDSYGLTHGGRSVRQGKRLETPRGHSGRLLGGNLPLSTSGL